MLLVAVAICYSSTAFHYYLNGYKWMNMGTIVSFLWGTVLLVNFISPFQWYPMSNKGCSYLLVGIVALNIGLFRFKPNNKYLIDNNNHNNTLLELFSTKDVPNTFFLIQNVLILFMIPIVIKAVGLLINSGFDLYVLRFAYSNATDSHAFMSTAQRLFYIHYCIGPCSFACILIDSVLCLNNRFWKKPLYYLLILTILQTVSSAGRSSIFFSVIVFFLYYYSLKNQFSPAGSCKSVRTKVLVFLIILVLMMIVITLLRNNGHHSIITTIVHSIVSYFCGGVRVFDQIIRHPNAFGLFDETYGMSTFAGLFSILLFLNHYSLGLVGLSFIPPDFSIYDTVQGYLINSIPIGINAEMNAFPTMFYFFFRDFGLISFILFPLLFGFLLSTIEKLYYLNRAPFYTFLYFYLLYTAIMSVCWWEPIRTEFWMVLIWGFVLCLILRKRITIKL